MQKAHFVRPNSTHFLLGITILLGVLFYSGCQPYPPYKSGEIYRAYDGPVLPKDKVAVVWGAHEAAIISIDGITLNEYAIQHPDSPRFRGVELLPGQYDIEVRVGCYKAEHYTIKLDADLIGGHVYGLTKACDVHGDYDNQYALSLIDKETGALVAGRSPEVLKWKWQDWSLALHKLKRNSITKKKVIELLSEPYDQLPENTLVYLASADKGLTNDWPIYNKPRPNTGFLFVQFDEFDRTKDFIFIEVPFRECYQNPLSVNDAEAWHTEYRDCRFRLKDSAYAEYHDMIRKSID